MGNRDPRLSKFVTNFFLLTDTPFLLMRKRGDGSRGDSEREEGGAWALPANPACPLDPLPFPQPLSGKWWGWGGKGTWGEAVGQQCVRPRTLTVPSPVPLWSTPSACTCATLGCGPRVGTRSRGGISSEKRCFPECPSLALSFPKTPGKPPDSVPLGAGSTSLASQK